MTNFDLHDQAQQLADTRSAYSLARELLMARQPWTDAQCLEFLSVAFRHCDIKGEIHMNEIRQGVAAALADAPKPEALCQA